MKITVNAPSFKRPEGVDTLNYLPFCRIWVCETEAEAYRKANRGADIVAVKKGVQGNLCRIRNWILDREFEAGTDAVCLIDDDLQMIGYFEQKKRTRLDSDQVMTWLKKHTRLADEWGVKIWGVNLNQDKQSYREYTPFSTLSPIGGPFSVHLPNPIRYDERLPLKEDYDMTLQHLNRYRKVLRVNKFFYVVKQGGSGTGQKGGCAFYRNLKRETDQLELLQRKWGREIVRYDWNSRSHKSRKVQRVDINPVVKVPISGV